MPSLIIEEAFSGEAVGDALTSIGVSEEVKQIFIGKYNPVQYHGI